MNNFEKLQPPSTLPFSHTPPEQLHDTFIEIITLAQSNTPQARFTLLSLPLSTPGLSACAHFWTFCIKFEICAKNLTLANERLNQGFQHKAQPVQALKSAQKYLQQLAVKSDFASEILPKINKSQVFQQSVALMRKGAEFVENVEGDLEAYYAARKVQQEFVFVVGQEKVVQILGEIAE